MSAPAPQSQPTTDRPLTEAQLRALRWISEFPSTSAAWTVDGADIKKQHPDKWNKMRISGKLGSILIDKDDLRAIADLVTHYPSPDQLYALNEKGRAALTSPPEVSRG